MDGPVALMNGELPQQGFVTEHLPGAEYNRRERMFNQLHGQPCFGPDALVEIPQERSAAAQADPTVIDVRRMSFVAPVHVQRTRF